MCSVAVYYSKRPNVTSCVCFFFFFGEQMIVVIVIVMLCCSLYCSWNLTSHVRKLLSRTLIRRRLSEMERTQVTSFCLHLLCVLQIADTLMIPIGQTHDIGAHGKILRPERAQRGIRYAGDAGRLQRNNGSIKRWLLSMLFVRFEQSISEIFH